MPSTWALGNSAEVEKIQRSHGDLHHCEWGHPHLLPYSRAFWGPDGKTSTMIPTRRCLVWLNPELSFKTRKILLSQGNWHRGPKMLFK